MAKRSVKEGKAVIASGEALSTSIQMAKFAGLTVIPLDGWTTADIGIKVSTNGTDFYPLYHDNNGIQELVQIAGAAADKAYFVVLAFGATHLKLWSQSEGADVNQAADRTLLLLFKD